MQCECEHVDHFTRAAGRTDGAVHYYAADVERVTDVGTEVGSFLVCDTCKATCLAGLGMSEVDG